MRIGYADPPYPGCAHLYKNHPDYAGEVNHYLLAEKLIDDYDGFVLHTSSVALGEVLRCIKKAAPVGHSDCRVMAWVKPFAAFKPNVPVAYAWEPVIVKPARKQTVGRFPGETLRDWVSEPITMKRGLTGVKPDRVCWWAFEAVGAMPDDDLDDMFPGTGAVMRAWESWRAQLTLTGDAA